MTTTSLLMLIIIISLRIFFTNWSRP